MEIIEKYRIELEKDTDVNELNLKEAQMKLPGIKHKWASRYINHKMELQKLKKMEKEAISKLIEKMSDDVELSKIAKEKKIKSHELIIKINEKIIEQERCLEYIDSVNQIFKSMTYDIRNLVEIMKLEQT
jgi:hypothetical protein